MKIYIFFCLFLSTILLGNGAEQSLVEVSQQISSIDNLSDTELHNLWMQLQNALEGLKDQKSREKAKILVNIMVREKLKRIMEIKQAQDAFSTVLFELLLAIAFDGSALMLSGESAPYAIFASATRHLASSFAQFATQPGGRAVGTIASSASSTLVDWALKVPATGSLLNLDPISILSLGNIGVKSAINKLGYTETVISTLTQARPATKSVEAAIFSKFTKARQSAADFLRSLI